MKEDDEIERRAKKMRDRMSGKPDWRHGLVWTILFLAWLLFWLWMRSR